MEKNKQMIQKLTLGSMFAAMGILLKFGSFIVPLFGIPMLRIDLIPIPVVLSGIILGPIYGLIVGILTDVLGHFILPQGVFHFGFTLNLALVGFLSGMLMIFLKKRRISLKWMNLWVLGLLCFGGILYIFITPEIAIRQGEAVTIYVFTKGFKFLSISTILAIFLILIAPIVFFKIKDEKKNEALMRILLITSLIEIFVFILLTPIWIRSFTSVPYIFNVIPRIFRAVFLIPIKTYLVYYVYLVYQVVSDKLYLNTKRV
jgi:ECF transporter S component (folate family)